ncbi:MAG: hypothetical protein ACHQII_00670 [Bacteroidia bacterium]
MTTNNSKITPNSLDGEFKENANNVNHVPHDSTIDVNAMAATTTGGQVKGSVTASTGNRMQTTNEEGTENV